jgi:hypothetical protein
MMDNDIWTWTLYGAFVVAFLAGFPLAIIALGTWVYRFYRFGADWDDDRAEILMRLRALEKTVDLLLPQPPIK